MAAVKQTYTVVGVFEDRAHADQAVSELKKAGFRDDQIGVAMRHAEGIAATDESGTHAEEGTVAGVLTGLGLGALAGLGVLSGVVPVIGPAIAAGTLGVIFSNAAAGAAVAGLAGALIGYGIPEEEAKYYHSEFEEGRTIVTVHADGRSNEAAAILRRHEGYDVSERGSVNSRTAASEMPARAPGAKAGRGSDTIQLKEERLHANKQPVETGQVTVRKEVRTETQHIDVPVEREEVVIERTPVRGRATSDVIAEGGEIRIPVREEKVTVSKDAVVTEEVKVGKRVVRDTEHVAGDVRKEEVKIERKGDVDVRTGGPRKA
jgi:uncharacterized protein (TIGR02271 family)